MLIIRHPYGTNTQAQVAYHLYSTLLRRLWLFVILQLTPSTAN